MKQEYDIKKRLDDLKDQTESSGFVPAEVLAGMGAKPTHKATELELEAAQRLIAGATSLLHKRSIKELDPPITIRQFEQWKNDVRILSKLVVTGYKPYSELYAWVEKSINMPDELSSAK
jgi:hypothetical protein